MSNNVDERIVEMRFDNAQFERGVKSSVESVEQLKKGLNLDGAAKSLSNLDAAGKSFSLAGISAGVDTIASKFSTLGIIGVTALANITNSAVNAGKRIVSALTIDPIKTGLQEYETKMGSIQTILTNTASKGTTLQDVNDVLQELNEYSDKTIYNFSEMTRNIGTFTAAGVDLKTSATAIKGIANLAAGSGSNAQQASTAMYQLSQALAAGSVKLQDWNSVVNAGMGGELFQNALKATAKEMGIVVDQGKPFRETLQDGWLTADVLTKTLEKFANDESLTKAATQVKTFTQLFDTMKESVQSGWAVSWESIIGNKEQSTELLTGISNAFNSIIKPSTDARNAMLQFWNANGGRDAMIQGLANVFQGLASVLKPVRDAFMEVFPPTTGEKLVAFSVAFKELTSKFKMGEEATKNLKDTFKGLFVILDGVKQGALAVAGVFGAVVSSAMPIVVAMLRVTGAIGRLLVAFGEAIKSSGILQFTMQTLSGIVTTIAIIIETAINGIIDAFEAFVKVDTGKIEGFGDRVRKGFTPFSTLGDMVSRGLFKIAEGLKSTMPYVSTFAEKLGTVFKSIQTSITNAFGEFDPSSILNLINSGLFAAILVSMKKFISTLSGIAKDGGGIIGLLDGVKGSLEAYQSKLKADVLLTIAAAIGILAASLIALSMIDPAKMTSALSAMSVMFIELFASMAIFDKIMSSSGFKAMGKVTLSMVALSTAVLILSFAMRNLATLDWPGVLKGLTSVAVLCGTLAVTANILSKSSGKMMRGATGLVIFAAAISILADAVKKLGETNVGDLTKGLVGVGVLVTELALFLKMANFDGFGVMKGAGLLILAAAINVLAEAVKKFASIDTGAMIKGLAAVGTVLSELAIFVNLTGNAKHVITTAIGLTILGGAMIVFAEAIKRLGSIPLNEIGKGLLAMGSSLVIIAVAMRLMPKNMILMGTGLVVVASALVVLSNALKSMGGMSWDEIARGLTALGGSMLILAVGMGLMRGALGGAAALLVIAGALTLFVPALKTLGSMSVGEITTGLLALAGAFAVIGVSAMVLTPLIPAIMGLGIGIGLIGVGCLAAGAGLLAFSAALGALAISGAAGAAALTAMVTSIIALIPYMLEQVGVGIIAFAGVIANGGPAIVSAITTVLMSLMQAIQTTTPAIVSTLMLMLQTMLSAIVQFIPQLVDAGMKLLIGFLKGIANNIKQVVTTAIDVVVNFIDGVASQIPRVIQAGFNLIIKFINGLADAIRTNTPVVLDAIRNLITALIESAVAFVTDPVKGAMSIGKNIVSGLVEGIKTNVGNAVEAAKNLGGKILGAVTNFFDINSPSRVMRDEVGRYIVQGIAEGITKDMSAEEAATKKAENIVSAFKNAVSKLDLGLTTKSLEYDLWITVSANTATASEKAAKELALLGEQIKTQQEKVELAKAEYETMMKTLGQDNAETKSAYNRYLTEQINMGKLNNQMTENRKNDALRQQQAARDYYDWMAQNADGLLKLGFKMEEIEAEARAQSGFDVAPMTQNMATNVETAVTTAMTTVKDVYKKKSETTFGGLLTGFSDWGKNYAGNLGAGFTTAFELAFIKMKEKLDGMDKELDTRLSNAAQRMQSLLGVDLNFSPSITPVLDLSQVKADSKQIGSIISGGGSSGGIQVGGLKDIVSNIAKTITLPFTAAASKSDSKSSSNTTSVSYTQNNYSPKALSRTDIYRETKNTISTLKGLLT